MLTAKEIQKYSKLTMPKLKAKAQAVFNKWIRERDKGQPCISCNSGQPNQACHYLSQGHHSALRFNEDNCHLGCVKCNLFLHGNLVNYRKGLIKKIGEERVLALENTRKAAHKWDRLELIAIIEKYKL